MLSGRKNKDDEDDVIPCEATMDSDILQGHTHTCSGRHMDGGHLCASATCRRWFWKKGTRV